MAFANPDNPTDATGNDDAFAMTLHYNTADFIATNNPFVSGGGEIAAQKSLYNGNIAAWKSAMLDQNNPDNYISKTHQYAYDQLNRIKAAKLKDQANAFAADFSYDGNGNLQTLNRYDQNANMFDDLSYTYKSPDNNRLDHVQDMAGYSDIDDIETQDPDNYRYDAIGNLIEDKQGNIADIQWTASGKISKITFADASKNNDISNMEFVYDATGNRVAKRKHFSDGTTTTDYYLRDAQGNMLAGYEGAPISQGVQSPTYKQTEVQLYGSDRLGTWKEEVDFFGGGPTQPPTNTASRTIGQKRYELKDHLGNVRAVVSDRKAAPSLAQILSQTDYYPFGMEHVDARLAGLGYRFGFNGKMKDDEVYGEGNFYDYGFRMYDPRIARFPSADPIIVKEGKYPELSSYQYASNRPIDGIDLDGLEYVSSDDAAVEFRNGNLHIKLSNLSGWTQHNINMANNPSNWKQGQQGLDLNIGRIIYHPAKNLPTDELEFPKTEDIKQSWPPPGRKNLKPGKYGNTHDLRYNSNKYRFATDYDGAINPSAGAGKGLAALNVVIEGTKLYAQYLVASDLNNIKNHAMLARKATETFNRANSMGLIPSSILESQGRRSMLMNYILQGDLSRDANRYGQEAQDLIIRTGDTILKDVSKNKLYQLNGIQNTGSLTAPTDNTRIRPIKSPND